MWHLRFFGTQFAVLALLSFMGSQAAQAGYPVSSEFSMDQSQEARGLDGSFQVAVMGSSTSPLDIPTEKFPKKTPSKKPVIEKPQVAPPAVEKPKANSKKASKPKKKKVKTANVKKSSGKKIGACGCEEGRGRLPHQNPEDAGGRWQHFEVPGEERGRLAHQNPEYSSR